MEIVLNAAGGLALFLLAMVMMTEGLKTFVGRGLKTFLQKWTSNPLRGVISGALVTALVQSSSAVTVATIGFVNAGVLTLKQALGIIFGSNVGTTMTAWLVSLVGFGLKIEALAMPILAFGVAFRFMAPQKKFQALGEALTGFGLFFLGLAVLKDAFSGVAETFGTSILISGDASGAFMFIAVGFAATVLTQSSSAAIALILMAASESIIGVNAAAAAIIGANVGTTSTAIFASINATPNAKRVAAGHVAFNLITGIVALALLPGILVITQYAGHWFGVHGSTVPFLALFHTIFNVLGIVVLFPFISRLSNYLERLFKTEEEDISRPQYLDETVASTPAMAVSALWQELTRMNDYACATVSSALSGVKITPHTIKRKSEAVFSLGEVITEFITTVHMEAMSREVAEELPSIIRTARYLEEASRLAPESAALVLEIKTIKKYELKKLLDDFITSTGEAVVLFSKKEKEEDHHDKAVIAMDKFQSAYQAVKAELLKAATSKALSQEKTDELLDILSHMRRMTEQMSKADKMLHKVHIE
ncbi:MAG: Na/Pi cotransporter [Micavibrio sp.]|nr:Na/Pi cotransporter [Micavibrio sp.]